MKKITPIDYLNANIIGIVYDFLVVRGRKGAEL